MASLPTRTTASFAAIAPVPNLTVLDAEFNQYVGASGIFNGGTTGTKLLTKTSDANDPVYELDQVGAGPVLECKVNGTLKVWVNNSGQVVSEVATGTAPFDVDSTTKVTNLNADLLDGIEASAFPLLASSVSAWSKTWFYPVLPGAVETTESVDRLIVPVSTAFTVTSITSVWAAGSDSGASNVFTIKRRNSAGVAQSNVGTIDVNDAGQDALNSGAVSVALTAGDQIYPLFTTRNTASETLVSITIRGTQRLT
jgi:hypothetical protein